MVPIHLIQIKLLEVKKINRKNICKAYHYKFNCSNKIIHIENHNFQVLILIIIKKMDNFSNKYLTKK
jgi:hypothetical protein